MDEARTLLDSLEVIEPFPMDDGAGNKYSRDQFPHWKNAEKYGWDLPEGVTGCDTRKAALLRDAVDDPDTPEDESDITPGKRCKVDKGRWVDPYTVDTVATEASDIDIDHMVPLAAAWRSGAADQSVWTEEMRTEYANSPRVTLATGDTANQEKGDKGPEAWKPTNEAEWCHYSVMWVDVKAKPLDSHPDVKLGLTSNEERAALVDMLDTCQS